MRPAPEQARARRWGAARGAHDSPPSTARSPPSLARPLEALGQVADEVAQRLAVARQRGDRDPLVGAVVARAVGAELDRRDARPRGTSRRRRRRRGPTLSDSPLRQPRRRRRRAPSRTGSSATTYAGLRMKVRGISMSGIPRICSRMSPGSWLGR